MTCNFITGMLVNNCWTNVHCGKIIGGLADFIFTFKTGTIDPQWWTVTIPPTVYMMSDDNGGCKTLISGGSSATSAIKLGEPFFLNTTVQLDYDL